MTYRVIHLNWSCDQHLRFDSNRLQVATNIHKGQKENFRREKSRLKRFNKNERVKNLIKRSTTLENIHIQ